MVWRFKLHTPSSAPRLAAYVMVLALGLLTGGLTTVHGAGPEEYAVIVSPDVLKDDLSLDELRRIFLFERRYWSSGRKITMLYSDSQLEAGSYLLDEIYGMSYGEVRLMILQRIYSVKLDLAPKVVASCALAARFVASGRGLLSLVPAESVADAEVKVLTIDGKALGDEGYPLRR